MRRNRKRNVPRVFEWRGPALAFVLICALLLSGCATAERLVDWVEGGPNPLVGSPETRHIGGGEVLAAQVGYVLDARETEVAGQVATIQSIELIVTRGARRGEVLQVEHRLYPLAGDRPLVEGDRVYVQAETGAGGAPVYLVSGYQRTTGLAVLAGVFVLLVLGVAQGRGARALLGMALSFLILYVYVLPRLAVGAAPVRSALIGAAVALPLLYFTAHGMGRKTLVALAGSLVGLGVTAGLAVLAADLVHLSGYASDEMSFLRAAHGDGVDALGLVLAGMIVGVLGVLDDITIAQAALVEQLAAVDAALGWRDLYARAMRVGRDHIASMVNTLVLVYAGASLPLLLLLGDRSLPLGYILSQEIVAEEVVRILVTSSGLVAVVPLVTVLAAVTARVWPWSADA